ncbi:(2Fe-2S)-binding protein [Flectobacillus major]|uniref:(2Fe-2S)-binding protein n=1 Tax=Flectobacillus major TaxID=103 RepID=UPI00041031B2|nr:(2Fe-2S)-binding protein [Flectobacillus major]
MKLTFELNRKKQAIEVPEGMPLLWIIRDILNLKGTKYGCGKGLCGSCTVLVNNEAVRSCSYPANLVQNKQITTIEGIGEAEQLHPVQQAWLEEIVPQCGYCQPGFMMATVKLLQEYPKPTNQQIDEYITNICRCGTYYRIRKAIHRAAEIAHKKD